jgi:pyrroloquinoline-quinone synthase
MGHLTSTSGRSNFAAMIEALDDLIAKHDLNEHPFYRAWRMGTLPRAALARYAAEYAPFIATIASGWEALGDGDHAMTEREHAGMWARFREALGASEATACGEARDLAAQAQRDFQERSTSLGALYAFESQQPKTTRSKLDGLQQHYGVSEDAYFRAHADDYGERDRLAKMIEHLDEGERARAIDACERTCQAMWSALSGVMAAA